MHHIKESLLQLAESEQAYSRTPEPSLPRSPPVSECSSFRKVDTAAKLASNPNFATASLRRSGRRKVALTDKLQETSAAAAAPAPAAAAEAAALHAVAGTATISTTTVTSATVMLRESSDSGCSSLPEKAILESFVRAFRTTPSGKRQMLISYYDPQLEEAEAPT